jgi:hypothetical protein
MVSATALAIVFTALAAKHLLADYVLQSSWMAHGKQRSHDWLAPLAVHAGCHGVLTTAVALAAAPRLWWLGLVDFFVHSSIDRCKGIAGRGLPLDTRAPVVLVVDGDRSVASPSDRLLSRGHHRVRSLK